jgi:dipeptidase
MVAQLRGWLPDSIGGVYWFYVDNPYVSTYAPVYAGVQEISPYYKNYDAGRYSEDSARWTVDLADNLLHLRWKEAIQDLWEVRDPMEERFFSEQAEIEKKARELHEQDPDEAKKYLTDLTRTRMDQIVAMYRELQRVLITKYTNNTY